MGLWPWRKRSKTNSGGKRPSNAPFDDSRTNLTSSLTRQRTPSIRSVSSNKLRRRNDALKAFKRSTIRAYHVPSNAGEGSSSAARVAAAPSSRDVQMSSPSPTPAPVAQLQTPVQTPPASQPISLPVPERRRSTSSTSSHRPRKRHTLKKTPNASDLRRTPSSAYPSPPPDRNNPQLYRTMSTPHRFASLRRSDSRFRAFGRQETSERPMSEMSARTRESLHSVDMDQESISSHSSMRAFKVRSFGILSPRPTLRLSSNPYSPSSSHSKMPDYPSNHDRKSSKFGWKQDLTGPIAEEPPTLKRNRVYGLADDLDSKGIREALERDTRRRERKQQEQEAKAQTKLEKKAAKQRADEDRTTMQAFADNQKRARERDNMHVVQIPGAEGAIIPVVKPNDEPSSIKSPVSPVSPISPATGTQTPLSWLQGPSQENITVVPREHTHDLPVISEPRKSMDNSSYQSDNEQDDTVIQTAQAIRLSGYSVASPPPSPTMVRSPKLVDHSPTHSRKMSRDLRTMDLQPKVEEGEEHQELATAWTAFFRKATAARVEKEYEAQIEAKAESEAQAQTLESRERKEEGTKSPGDTTVVLGVSQAMPGTFLQSPTPRSVRSRVPSDHYLPDTLPTPKQSEVSLSREISNEDLQNKRSKLSTAPRSPSRFMPVSPLSRNFSDARKPQITPVQRNMSPRTTQTDLSERATTTGSHMSDLPYSAGTPTRASVSADRIRSMASIDSEGSWLSGRLNSRQSLTKIPSLRDSAASLRVQYHDIKAHEDRRASVADDQYFSGVQDMESSDEEEREILSNYLDDDHSIQRSSLNSPQTAYRSPPRSPISDIRDDLHDSDTDLEGDKYMWREGLGRRPTITRVDSNFVRKREEIGSLYDASSLETQDFSPAPMTAEMLIEDGEGNLIGSPNRRRDSPSPTLGKNSPRFFTPKEFSVSGPFAAGASSGGNGIGGLLDKGDSLKAKNMYR